MASSHLSSFRRSVRRRGLRTHTSVYPMLPKCPRSSPALSHRPSATLPLPSRLLTLSGMRRDRIDLERMKLGSFRQLQSPLAFMAHFSRLTRSFWVRSANYNF